MSQAEIVAHLRDTVSGWRFWCSSDRSELHRSDQGPWKSWSTTAALPRAQTCCNAVRRASGVAAAHACGEQACG
jgi:hypothetical protein